MRAEEILKEAQATLIDRGLNYDSDGGERTMDVLVPAFNLITGHKLTRKQGYLFMVMLKAARSQQGADKMDNWVDMAAYAGLAGEAE